jgi:DNA-binding IclR family transcriptional regulator
MSIAKQAELPVGKVHLITCALIAKGLIVQKGRGEYSRGYPHVSVKQKESEPIELDLAVT